jgi:hypothetical protein
MNPCQLGEHPFSRNLWSLIFSKADAPPGLSASCEEPILGHWSGDMAEDAVQYAPLIILSVLKRYETPICSQILPSN